MSRAATGDPVATTSLAVAQGNGEHCSDEHRCAGSDQDRLDRTCWRHTENAVYAGERWLAHVTTAGWLCDGVEVICQLMQFLSHPFAAHRNAMTGGDDFRIQ